MRRLAILTSFRRMVARQERPGTGLGAGGIRGRAGVAASAATAARSVGRGAERRPAEAAAAAAAGEAAHRREEARVPAAEGLGHEPRRERGRERER